jgi:hypothetical protein
MSTILIGYTGFVGSNIASNFDNNRRFNSKNVQEAYGLEPELCIYTGVKSEKFYANQFPIEDLNHINNAFDNIKKINPKKIVLISTVDVYGEQLNSNENSFINGSNIPNYGSNRLYLEKLVANYFHDYHIIRLPGLFGKNLKKNFIFDMLNPIPRKISKQKFQELSLFQSTLMKDAYISIDDNFFELNQKNLTSSRNTILKDFLVKYNSTSLQFTDSRSSFQFYNLYNLWTDIQRVIYHKIKLINLVTEPINAAELYQFVLNKTFNNLTSKFYSYNLTSSYANIWNKQKHYLYTKDTILEDIKKFFHGHEA